MNGCATFSGLELICKTYRFKARIGLIRTHLINVLESGRVEAPDFSPGSGFFRTRVNRGFHTNPGFSPGLKNFDFITLAIYESVL
jgi:hypothetical protein